VSNPWVAFIVFVWLGAGLVMTEGGSKLRVWRLSYRMSGRAGSAIKTSRSLWLNRLSEISSKGRC
jgi:hypothetical protein